METDHIFAVASEWHSQRRSALKSLENYGEDWILLYEATQNALDALLDDATDETKEDGKVRIVLDPGKNSVEIADNGSGFPGNPKEQLSLDSTTKNGESMEAMGEHGVGMKMLLLSSRSFELWTQSQDGEMYHVECKDGYRFLAAKTSPEVEIRTLDAWPFTPEDRTVLRYEFPTAEQVDKAMAEAQKFIKSATLPVLSVRKWISALVSDPSLSTGSVHPEMKKERSESLFQLVLEYKLRTSPYIGNVNRLFDAKRRALVEVTLRHDPNPLVGSDTELASSYLNFNRDPVAVEFESVYWDPVEELHPDQRGGIRTAERLDLAKVSDARGAWNLKLTSPEEIRLLLKDPAARLKHKAGHFDSLIDENIRGIYIYIASASSSGTFHMERMVLGAAQQLIAANGLITTNELKTPKRGKNQNYLNNCHIVYDLNDSVNYGKQSVKRPHLLKSLHEFHEEIFVAKLTELAKAVAGKTKTKSASSTAAEVVARKKIIDPQGVRLHGCVDENDVIGLFHQLLALGNINGISPWGHSQTDEWDLLAEVAGLSSLPSIPRDSDLSKIEFKRDLSDFIDDCQRGDKNASEIDMVVCWAANVSASQGERWIWPDSEVEASPQYSEAKVTSKEGHSLPINLLRNMTSGEESLVLILSDLVTVDSA